MSRKRPKREDDDEAKVEEFGAFEKHTKGIGMKLLLKMGFKPGQGLGKEAEGRAEPVKIKLRPKGVGIGFSEDELDEELPDNGSEEKDNYFEKGKGLFINTKRNINVSTKDKKEDIMVCDDIDVVEMMKFNGGEDEIKIIDMTKSSKYTGKTDLEIISEIKTKKRQEEMIINQKKFELDSALNQLERNILEAEKERKRLIEIQKRNEIKKIITEFMSRDYSDNFELICTEIEKLPVEKDELLLFNDAIGSVLFPILEKYSPLPLGMMDKMSKILPTPIYDQIIYHLWWPSIKYPHFTGPISNLQDWREVIKILNDWYLLLPGDFLNLFLLNQILIPRIHSLLQDQDQDHEIVLEIMKKLKNQIPEIPPILEKDFINWLGNRIKNVKVRDFEELMIEIDENWRKQLPELTTLLLGRIERLLQRDLIIDPSDQDLHAINCILSLKSHKILIPQQISHILTIHLIPKLKKCLQKWIKSLNVDFEEIAEWYLAWKDIFPEDLLLENDSELMDGFGELLTFINENIE